MHASFHGIDVESRNCPTNDELEQRCFGVEDGRECIVAALLTQIGGIETVRCDDDKRVGDELGIFGERLGRGFLPGLIGVEREDDFAAAARVAGRDNSISYFYSISWTFLLSSR